MRDLTVLPDLDIALVQSSLAWHDAQANREHFAALLESAAGADLVVLPEMFTTGFSMASAEQAEAAMGIGGLHGRPSRTFAAIARFLPGQARPVL